MCSRLKGGPRLVTRWAGPVCVAGRAIGGCGGVPKHACVWGTCSPLLNLGIRLWARTEADAPFV